ncbi:3'-5' exonuclease [Caldibacillus debilis]|uniref:Superfamily I DNA and RNA helicase n=1 Tax=Caldibacillus debilis GB1 TaxID=1339248 RepID=A0A420VFW0_9BACI|nr:3'-5' exonuclease [Caldibacillus debilis]RKO62529.1 Superfamily I DNA and RNA helicase [Caldibacillus debilis GB1]
MLWNKVVPREMEGELIAPQSTKRKGPEPEIIKVESFAKEMDMVVNKILQHHQEMKVPFSEILILYRVKCTHQLGVIDTIKFTLDRYQLPYDRISENNESKRTFKRKENWIKISTIDSSKGLNFQAVFIVNVDSMPFPLKEDKEREVSLLYIAMTRAKEHLFLSYSGISEFTQYFDEYQKKGRWKKSM